MTLESRHQYQEWNHRVEAFVFADATTRAAGSGLTLPSGTPYTLVSADIGRIAYQTDTGAYYRLTGVGPIAWVLFGGGSGGGSNTGIFTAQNKDGATISAGMPAARHSSGTGVVHGNATDASKQAVGLAVADISASVSGNVQVDGLLTLADWTAVVGSTTLIALGLYYLNTTSGLLSTTPPSTVGNVVQLVGRAVATDTMEILCAQGITL